VALMPVRVGSRILGLIHVADYQEDMVPLSLVEVLEKVGMWLGQALKRLQAEERNRALSHELMRAQEQERQKISRELHDSVAQELAALKILLENLALKMPNIPGVAINLKISELLQGLQRSLSSVRNLSYGLRPPDLEHLGLVQAIQRYCEEITARTGLHIDFSAAGIESGHLTYETAITLYRIVQEGLTNVWRHAQADNVTLKLVASFPQIILRLEDDGQGFDVAGQEASMTRENQLGLVGMRERVALLGGEMDLQSEAQKGTKITIKIPWNSEGPSGPEEDSHR
jgi:signal transduction histidine kinase